MNLDFCCDIQMVGLESGVNMKASILPQDQAGGGV